jgi:hypothetical protein
MTNLMRASYEWATRPPEQRFDSVESLGQSVALRRTRSYESTRTLGSLDVVAHDEQLFLNGHNGRQAKFTNWSFGQYARLMKSPANFLRELPAKMVADIFAQRKISYGSTPQKLLYSAPLDGTAYGTAQGLTGPKYGRIWDEELVQAVQYINQDGRWKMPLKAYDGVYSTEASTIYGSEKDVFIFLVDEERAIEVDGQTFFRGFYAWNSEVGSATLGLCTFLFSYVCQNRIIWGATKVEQRRIRHTAGAPMRFAHETRPALAAIANASDQPVIASIRKAKSVRVGTTAKGVEQWLRERGFSKSDAQAGMKAAEQGGSTGSSGDPTNVFDLVQGGTYVAQLEKHTDERVRLERQWSSLLCPYMPAEQTLSIDVEEGVA